MTRDGEESDHGNPTEGIERLAEIATVIPQGLSRIDFEQIDSIEQAIELLGGKDEIQLATYTSVGGSVVPVEKEELEGVRFLITSITEKDSDEFINTKYIIVQGMTFEEPSFKFVFTDSSAEVGIRPMLSKWAADRIAAGKRPAGLICNGLKKSVYKTTNEKGEPITGTTWHINLRQRRVGA